ncbi:hypothetical protein ILYODFUR_032379 [Ilyodon furcidens]|uniref:Uncharacterized protein n=1 Tax=Ilyodon furcidens TaxID=33524 RepID=A0ABV0UA91_9TELE
MHAMHACRWRLHPNSLLCFDWLAVVQSGSFIQHHCTPPHPGQVISILFIDFFYLPLIINCLKPLQAEYILHYWPQNNNINWLPPEVHPAQSPGLHLSVDH